MDNKKLDIIKTLNSDYRCLVEKRREQVGQVSKFYHNLEKLFANEVLSLPGELFDSEIVSSSWLRGTSDYIEAEDGTKIAIHIECLSNGEINIHLWTKIQQLNGCTHEDIRFNDVTGENNLEYGDLTSNKKKCLEKVYNSCYGSQTNVENLITDAFKLATDDMLNHVINQARARNDDLTATIRGES